MAKVAFTKLSLKKKEEIKTIEINGQIIEVKQYLPVNEKLALISNVINNAIIQDNSFKNPVKVEVYGTLEIIYAYTNITFTEKQKEDAAKLYDLLEENGVISAIMEVIPENEYNFIIDGIEDSIDSYYAFQVSALGILERITSDYTDLNFDVTALQEKIANPENLKLLKDVLNELG